MSQADRDKWNARYADRGTQVVEPDGFLRSHGYALPRSGRAVDVAGGAGRHAIWLANRGLDTTLLDISETGMSIAKTLARSAGVTLNTVVADLETGGLPAGRWDVVLVFHYLHRPLFSQLIDAVAPGGLLVYCHPTRRNLERHQHPSARFLLGHRELPTLIGDLGLLYYEENWSDAGRHEARLIARRPAAH